MSRAKDLASRAAAVSAHSATTTAARGATEPEPAVPPVEPRRPARPEAPRPAPRTRPVRITVDLAPVEHRRLKRWCDEAAGTLGRGSVSGADVVRSLLARLHHDEDLAHAVIADIARRLS